MKVNIDKVYYDSIDTLRDNLSTLEYIKDNIDIAGEYLKEVEYLKMIGYLQQSIDNLKDNLNKRELELLEL